MLRRPGIENEKRIAVEETYRYWPIVEVGRAMLDQQTDITEAENVEENRHAGIKNLRDQSKAVEHLGINPGSTQRVSSVRQAHRQTAAPSSAIPK